MFSHAMMLRYFFPAFFRSTIPLAREREMIRRTLGPTAVVMMSASRMALFSATGSLERTPETLVIFFLGSSGSTSWIVIVYSLYLLSAVISLSTTSAKVTW